MKELKPAVLITLVFGILTGLIFPAAVWMTGQVAFPFEANGSLVRTKTGNIVGSAIIGQPFTGEKYIHPRPSAAGSGYDAAASGGTNLGPTSEKLVRGIKDDPTTPADESFAGIMDLAVSYRAENNVAPDVLLPSDAVTRSGSGLDPDISVLNAKLQAKRVAVARGLAVDEVEAVIRHNSVKPFLGLIGEPRVNVLQVNLALDSLQGRPD